MCLTIYHRCESIIYLNGNNVLFSCRVVFEIVFGYKHIPWCDLLFGLLNNYIIIIDAYCSVIYLRHNNMYIRFFVNDQIRTPIDLLCRKQKIITFVCKIQYHLCHHICQSIIIVFMPSRNNNFILLELMLTYCRHDILEGTKRKSNIALY